MLNEKTAIYLIENSFFLTIQPHEIQISLCKRLYFNVIIDKYN